MSPCEFTEFADLFPEALLLVEGDGRIVSANKAATQILGLSNERSHLLQISSGSPEAILSYLRQCRSSSQMVVGALAIHSLTDGLMCFRLEGCRACFGGLPPNIILRFKTRESASTAFLLLTQKIDDLAREIRERRRIADELARSKLLLEEHAQELEKRVQQRTARLQEAIGSLESFCYSIAHDLRAPLRTINSFTSILVQDYAPCFDEEGKNLATRIQQASYRMEQMIRDLLALGHLTQEQISLNKVNLDNQLTLVLHSIEEEIRLRKADVTVLSPLGFVIGNSALIQQVLLNLVANAIKFVEPERNPKVEIGVQDKEQFRRIWIKDNGIGIAPEYQNKIFGIFERLTPTKYPGTGIGLALVKKGVERMGGKVGLKSEEGKGSCFWFELPNPDAQRRTQTEIND